MRVMHPVDPYGEIQDPHDPAWAGYANAAASRRDGWGARHASIGVVVAVLVAASVVTAALRIGGAASEGAIAPSAQAAQRDAGGQGVDRGDVGAPADAPHEAGERPPTTLPDVRAAATIDPAAQGTAVALTGPTGDVGLSATYETTSFPSLYIDDGSGAIGGSSPGATANLSGKLQGLDALLRSRLDALGAALGVRIDVISGFRTHQEQQALYRQYLAGTGNLAAVPGTSRHESGRAADAYVNGTALALVPGAREAAARIGIGFPVGGEPWHTEVVAGDALTR